MTVAQILKEKGNKVISVAGQDTILHALEVMKQHHIGALLVLGPRDKIAGVLSERDIVRALPDSGASLLADPVSSLMTKDVITCTPDHSISDVMALMTKHRFRHMPVLKDGKLIGVISIGDAVKERISETEHEAEALRSYITSG